MSDKVNVWLEYLSTGRRALLIDDAETIKTLQALQLAAGSLPNQEHNPLSKVNELVENFYLKSKSGVVVPEELKNKQYDKDELNSQFTKPHVFNEAAKYYRQKWEAIKDSAFTIAEGKKLSYDKDVDFLRLFTDNNKEKTLKVLADLADDIKYNQNRNRYAERLGVPKTLGVGL